MGLTGNLFEGDSFSESYLSLLRGIMQRGKEKSPRGEKVRYIQDALFRVNAPGDVLSTPSRPYPVKYLNNELRLYFSGTLSGDEFGEASKFWLKLKNPDGTINSNYGHLVFYRGISNAFEQGKTQWQWAKQQRTVTVREGGRTERTDGRAPRAPDRLPAAERDAA